MRSLRLRKNHSMSASGLPSLSFTPIIFEFASESFTESKSVRMEVESAKSDERCLRMKSMRTRLADHLPNSPVCDSWPIATLSDLMSESAGP